ncbi:hypothetical protein ABIB68_007760 [Bradyrhizobium sp. F1.2.2]
MPRFRRGSRFEHIEWTDFAAAERAGLPAPMPKMRENRRKLRILQSPVFVCDHRCVPPARPCGPRISADFATGEGGRCLLAPGRIPELFLGAGNRKRHLPALVDFGDDEPVSGRRWRSSRRAGKPLRFAQGRPQVAGRIEVAERPRRERRSADRNLSTGDGRAVLWTRHAAEPWSWLPSEVDATVDE